MSDRYGLNQLWRVAANGSQPERISDKVGSLRPKGSPDGKKLYFQRQPNIWEISLDDKTERQLTDLSVVGSASMNQYDHGDGRYFYFIWRQRAGDTWVMDVEQED